MVGPFLEIGPVWGLYMSVVAVRARMPRGRASQLRVAGRRSSPRVLPHTPGVSVTIRRVDIVRARARQARGTAERRDARNTDGSHVYIAHAHLL